MYKPYVGDLRGIFILCLAMLLVFSSFVGSYDVLANENTVEKNDFQYAKTHSNTTVYAEDGETELGQIAKDSIFPIQKQEGNQVLIQWDDRFAIINEADIEILGDIEDRETLFVTFDEVESHGKFTVPEEIEVTSERNDFSLKIFEGVNYSFISTDKEVYEILVGNRVMSVDKDSVKIEESGPEKDHITNEESTNKESTNEGQNVEQNKAEESADEEEPAEEITGQVNLDEEQAENSVGKQQQDHEKELNESGENEGNTNEDSGATDSHLTINQSNNFSPNTKYFKVLTENLTVYERTENGRITVGSLDKGQVYPRIGDYGDNWHRIQYGTGYGYVYKPGTTPADSSAVHNENKGKYDHSDRQAKVLSDLPVYDNSSGDLVKFATLKKGIKYPIVSDYGSWYRIEVSGRIGYIYKSGVEVDFQRGDKYFEVTSDNLTVYKQTNNGLVAVGSLEKGQVYPRVSDYGNWHRIQYGKDYGYVWKESTLPSNGSGLHDENKGKYEHSDRQAKVLSDLPVYDNSSGNLIPFATLKKGINYAIVSDYGSWYRILVSGRIGYIYKDGVLPEFQAEDEYFEVLSDNLTVYKKGKSASIGTLEKGEVYPRISEYGPSWHRIKFGSGYGYVHTSGTRPASGKEIQNENRGKYQDTDRTFKAERDLPVYDNSSGSLVPFATIKKGQNYPVISGYGLNWYRVDISGRIGYVPTSGTEAEFRENDQYFEVLEDNLTVYRKGKSAILGTLKKGEVYPRFSAFGDDWHRIKFGSEYGYVYALGTRPASGDAIQNENTDFRDGNRWFKTLGDVPVYDNSSGNLVPFATIKEGRTYPIVSDYGDWWRVDLSGRIGYVYKDSVFYYKQENYTEYDLSFEEMVDIQIGVSPQTDLYRNKKAYVYGENIEVDKSSSDKGVVKTSILRVREQPDSKSWAYGNLEKGEVVNIIEKIKKEDGLWYEIEYGSWRNAKREDVIHYLNPDNHDEFQHLVLSGSAGISKYDLNTFLKGKGILEGEGSSFIEASRQHNVNEIYLLSHALHETGNGTSTLAKGYKVNGKIVYNMYGIGAVDSCPLECGAQRAYDEGWFTPEKAIIGGAKFIAEDYISRGQDTLYKMRWNPANPGIHQYATDIGWATKQVGRIKDLYEELENYILYFDIPVFK